MTPQLEVLYLNRATVDMNAPEMEVIEKREKILEERPEREDSEVSEEDEEETAEKLSTSTMKKDGDDAPVVAALKSQEIFVDRLGNNNKKPRRKLEKKAKSFTLRATKRLFKALSKRKSVSSTNNNTLQKNASVVLASALSICTKPTFDSTTESEEGEDLLLVNVNHNQEQNKLEVEETEEAQQQHEANKAVADAVLDIIIDPSFAAEVLTPVVKEQEAKADVDVDVDVDEEDKEQNKLVTEEVEELDAVMNDVIVPSSIEMLTSLIQEQEEQEAYTTIFDDNADDDEEEYYKLPTEEAIEVQKKETVTPAADVVMNKVMDPSLIRNVMPLVKEYGGGGRQEEEYDDASFRTLLCVYVCMILGIAINMYCTAQYYDLFMDQGQQLLQEQVVVATTPTRTVVRVVAKWLRTIVTNKRN